MLRITREFPRSPYRVSRIWLPDLFGISDHDFLRFFGFDRNRMCQRKRGTRRTIGLETTHNWKNVLGFFCMFNWSWGMPILYTYIYIYTSHFPFPRIARMFALQEKRTKCLAWQRKNFPTPAGFLYFFSKFVIVGCLRVHITYARVYLCGKAGCGGCKGLIKSKEELLLLHVEHYVGIRRWRSWNIAINMSELLLLLSLRIFWEILHTWHYKRRRRRVYEMFLSGNHEECSNCKGNFCVFFFLILLDIILQWI